MCQGQFITHYPKNFVTNRCRANPNTSPDSPFDGESGEVFRFALHLLVTKFFGPWVMNQPWHIRGVICVPKVGAFWHEMHSEGRCIWCFIQQRVNVIHRWLTWYFCPNECHFKGICNQVASPRQQAWNHTSYTKIYILSASHLSISGSALEAHLFQKCLFIFPIHWYSQTCL